MCFSSLFVPSGMIFKRHTIRRVTTYTTLLVFPIRTPPFSRLAGEERARDAAEGEPETTNTQSSSCWALGADEDNDL